MKTKSSLLITAASIALVGASYGQVVIDITGSTAGRSAVIGRVKALLDGESAAWVGNASETSANRQIYYGGTYDGTPVTVRLFWSGSAAGVRDTSDAPELNASYIVSNYATAGLPGGLPGAPGRQDTALLAAASSETVSEIGFSDVFQTSTSFQANTLVNEVQVAVLPFVFMKNDGANAGITNMTAAGFQSLFGVLGELPLSFFTGVATDTAAVKATGRNNESGTRITTVACSYFGLGADLAQFTGTGDPATLTPVGNGGYSSGSSVATLLSATLTGGESLIGYVGIADGATAATGGASYLKFEGVDYTVDNVANGAYGMWGYLHQSAMFDPEVDTGTTVDFYVALRDAMIANPGGGTINLGLMKVERGTDGGVITAK